VAFTTVGNAFRVVLWMTRRYAKETALAFRYA
jgi:hypothetical protein